MNISFKAKVVKQLQKDFALIGYELEIKSKQKQAEIIEILAEKLKFIAIYKPNDLQKIAYVTDLNEANFKTALNSNVNKDFKVLALEILKRDALKVYLRSQFE